MKGRKRDQFVVLQYLGDALAVAAGLLVAYWIRLESDWIPHAVIATDYLTQFWWAFAFWMGALYASGAVTWHPRVISFNRARRILYAGLLATMLAAVRNYFFLVEDVSRLLYPIALVTTSSALIVNRFLLQCVISRFLITGGAQTRVILVGLGPVALRLAARFKSYREMGYDLVGFVSLDDRRVGQTIGGIPILGAQDDLRRIVRDNGVEEVFVCQTDIPAETFFQLFIDGDKEWARVNFVPSLVEMMRSQIHYDEVAGVPIYSMKDTPLRGLNAGLKRAFDLALALGGLIALSPLLLLLGILVKRSSPGPALYKQTRLGLDGREFNIYKFRTMPVGAEDEVPSWGKRDDPRATAIGRFLRRYNLDELPQLWNVIRGDMSLVGPRPERPWFVDRFREVLPRYMSRHNVKSGMTGWAQVHGLRGDTSIQQRLRYDLYYIENWSLWLDTKILIVTFFGSKRRGRVRSLRDQSKRILPTMIEVSGSNGRSEKTPLPPTGMMPSAKVQRR